MKNYPVGKELNLSKFGILMVFLKTFAKRLDPDQDQHNVGPDMDPNCLTH